MGVITAAHIKNAMDSETYSPRITVVVHGADGETLGSYPVEYMAPVTRGGFPIGEIALEVSAPDLIKRTEFREFLGEKELQEQLEECQEPKVKARGKLSRYIRDLWR